MRHLKLILAVPVLLGLPAPQAQANPPAHLTITPTYDSTITSNANAATIESSIQSEINVYQNSFSNPVNVNIAFKGNETISLGQSSTVISSLSYTQFRTALFATKATSTDNLDFENSFPAGPNNPVNNNSNIIVTSANARAIGIDYGLGSAGIDSTISLKTSIMNLSRTGAQDSSKYDLQTVVAHEIDEALGFGSALNGLANGATSPTRAIGVSDLYRFSAPGTRSLSTNVNANAYLSVDGGLTNLVNFNQTAGGDFSDYMSVAGSPHVQDAFNTPGAQADLGTAELTTLRDIGYNSSISAAPEPSQLAGLAFSAFGALGLILRSRKRRANP